jgi:hypothetical protein
MLLPIYYSILISTASVNVELITPQTQPSIEVVHTEDGCQLPQNN